MRLPILLPTLALTLSTTAQVQQIQLSPATGSQPSAAKLDADPAFAPNPFIGSFRMEMHHFVAGVEDTAGAMDLHLWNSADKTLMQFTPAGQKEEMRILKDLRAKAQYMLMTDPEGGKMAIKSDLQPVVIDEEVGRNAADIQVTEETKVIEGHTCQKMIAKDADGTWVGWLAKDFEAPFAQVVSSLGIDGNTRIDQIEGVYGFPMEYEWTSADSKEKLVCHLHDVVVGTVKDNVFSLEGYQVMELPVLGK